MIKYFSPQTILKFIKFWPPYLASGISIESVNPDFNHIVVKMKQSWHNTNYVGTHFGGSLYSMCDPFFMFILLHHLKDDHIVWDQSASIDFLKPGKGVVKADFYIPLEKIEFFKREALEKFNFRPEFHCQIKDQQNQIIAKVRKQLYIRRKDAKERFSVSR